MNKQVESVMSREHFEKKMNRNFYWGDWVDPLQHFVKYREKSSEFYFISFLQESHPIMVLKPKKNILLLIERGMEWICVTAPLKLVRMVITVTNSFRTSTGANGWQNTNKDIITKFKSQRFTHFGFIQCKLHSGKQLTVGSHQGLNLTPNTTTLCGHMNTEY